MPPRKCSDEEIQRAILTHPTKAAAARALGISERTIHVHSNKTVVEPPPARFEAPRLPSAHMPLDELIQARIEQGRRSREADNARDLIPIKVKIKGPFGLLIFGDPHVDADGCDFELLMRHRQLAIDHPHILAGNIGDNTNNWVGRLARLYAEQSTTAKDAWRLCEWFIKDVHWLFLIAGNHDLWSGSGDPLEWIARQANSLYEPHGVRLELKHPCGAKTRIHARHDFPGHSMWNVLHGPKREVMMGFRDHIVVAGHKHVGGDEGLITPDGIAAQIVRVSGYKVVDHYAHQLGLKKVPMHPAALIIIDPREPETSRARAFCAPTVEVGVTILDAMRRDYDSAR